MQVVIQKVDVKKRHFLVEQSSASTQTTVGEHTCDDCLGNVAVLPFCTHALDVYPQSLAYHLRRVPESLGL